MSGYIRKTAIHVFDFCAAVYDHEVLMRRRIRLNRETAYDETDPQGTMFEAVVQFISRRSGIIPHDVFEYIARAGRGGHWGAYASPARTKHLADISHVAQLMSGFSETSSMDELVEFLKARYPAAAKEMGLLGEHPPAATTKELDEDDYSILETVWELRAIDDQSHATADEVAKKAIDANVATPKFKSRLGKLVRLGLLASKEGRAGGYRLTEEGIAQAQAAVLQVPPPIAKEIAPPSSE